ncbi:MAG: hypothetical protein ACI9ON_003503, partial [Limisphaerales bacterium]
HKIGSSLFARKDSLLGCAIRLGICPGFELCASPAPLRGARSPKTSPSVNARSFFCVRLGFNGAMFKARPDTLGNCVI